MKAASLKVRSSRGNIFVRVPEITDLCVNDKNGGYDALTDDQVIARALDIVARRLIHNGPALLNPQATRDYLALKLADMEHEMFCCLYLDNRHKVIAFEELFRGTVDGANVHPREVVKRVLAHNASAVIIAHNHPSGVAEPSQADELITRRLKEALLLIDVRVLDHIIVGSLSHTSFAERGLL